MLANKKVYAGKFSREIQEKAFKLGFEWRNSGSEISNIDKPFLFFKEREITYANSVDVFNESPLQEITAEEILAFEILPPKKKWKDFGKVKGYCLNLYNEVEYYDQNDDVGNLDFDDKSQIMNILPTKEEAEAYKILPYLLQWRDRYNGFATFAVAKSEKMYFISRENDTFITGFMLFQHHIFSFKTEEIRDQFLEDFKEELEIVKPLL